MIKKIILVAVLLAGAPGVTQVMRGAPVDVPSQQKGIQISGTVVDSGKETLPGAVITVKGTTKGTTTDIDGHFYLEVPSKNSELEISYVGYKTKTIKVGSDISFYVTLDEAKETLDEVHKPRCQGGGSQGEGHHPAAV